MIEETLLEAELKMERAVEVRREGDPFIIYDRELPVLARDVLIKHRDAVLARRFLSFRYLRNRAAKCAP